MPHAACATLELNTKLGLVVKGGCVWSPVGRRVVGRRLRGSILPDPSLPGYQHPGDLQNTTELPFMSLNCALAVPSVCPSSVWQGGSTASKRGGKEHPLK